METTCDRKLSGFTLIELMVVIAVGAILLGMAVNAYASMRERTRIDSAKEQIVSVLQQARLRALSSGETQTATFRYVTDVVTSNSKTISFDEAIDLVGCTTGADQLRGITTFTFSRRGTGTADTMRVLSASSGRAYKVIVSNVGGRVRVEKDGVCS
ncbi:MAG: prepilin-type N-terminal cleavage/methylation domain-containing protein [Mariprofundaceae bacterium]